MWWINRLKFSVFNLLWRIFTIVLLILIYILNFLTIIKFIDNFMSTSELLIILNGEKYQTNQFVHFQRVFYSRDNKTK